MTFFLWSEKITEYTVVVGQLIVFKYLQSMIPTPVLTNLKSFVCACYA